MRSIKFCNFYWSSANSFVKIKKFKFSLFFDFQNIYFFPNPRRYFRTKKLISNPKCWKNNSEKESLLINRSLKKEEKKSQPFPFLLPPEMFSPASLEETKWIRLNDPSSKWDPRKVIKNNLKEKLFFSIFLLTLRTSNRRMNKKNSFSIIIRSAEEHLAELMPIFEQLRAQGDLPCTYPLHMSSPGTAFIRGGSRSTPLSPHAPHCHPSTHWVSF